MKYSSWAATLLIIISISGNIREFFTHPQPILAQSSKSQIEEANQLSQVVGEKYQHGDFIGSLELYQKALILYHTIGSKTDEEIVLSSMVSIYDNISQYAKAIALCQQSLQVMREIGDRNAKGVVLTNLGFVYYHLGQYYKDQIGRAHV